MFKWRITKDLLGTGKAGVGNAVASDVLEYPFRLKDDDGEIYYEGLCNGWDFPGWEVFAPLDWGEEEAGTTVMEYFENGMWQVL